MLCQAVDQKDIVTLLKKKWPQSFLFRFYRIGKKQNQTLKIQ